MARVYVKVSAGEIRKAVREKGTKNIIALTKNPNVLKDIAEKAIQLVNPYVPEDSGALQASGHVVYHEKQVQIVWGDSTKGSRGNPTSDYARYQFAGKVYGPNIPILVDGIIVGWCSPKNKPKSPTGEMLSYKSPTAISHWTNVIKRGGQEFDALIEYAEPRIKKEAQRESK